MKRITTGESVVSALVILLIALLLILARGDRTSPVATGGRASAQHRAVGERLG